MENLEIGNFVKMNTAFEQVENFWKVMATSEDELMLVSNNWKDRNHIILANKTLIKGIKFQVGDKVSIETKDKKKIEMFISFIADKDTITLSLKKKPSYLGLGWLLNFFQK